MRLASVSVQDFRNIGLARLGVTGGRLFLLGANGQGKTNLLEAIGLMTALRSFRTNDARSLIRWGAEEARVIHEVMGDDGIRSTLDVRLSATGKQIALDGNSVPRLADIIGRFPTVALSSQDIQLLRGGPSLRRRFLDMLLAGADRRYFEALRRYTQSLKERNALLRAGRAGPELTAFETPLAEAAVELVRMRRETVAELHPLLEETCRRIAGVDESPALEYRPDIDAAHAGDFLEQLRRHRPRDIALETTAHGPHKDDLALRLKEHQAREYASEGQQRGLVVALRLAQCRWIERRTGVLPLVLADDVLGELDAARREAFWKVLDPRTQVIATGTQVPGALGEGWEVVRVSDGALAGVA